MIFTLTAFIDLDALLHNVRLIRNRTKAQLYAVVKANAYGHGLAIAGFLQPYVDGFCVATFSEAARLARLAIYKPILVLGAPEKDATPLMYNNIVYTVGNLSDLRLIMKSRHSKFFIKLNTGMNRLGCKSVELDRIMYYVRHNNLNCQGIYTHFRNADTDLLSAKRQYEILNKSLLKYDFKFSHCCASNALYLDSSFHNNIVRVGLSLYGYNAHCNGLLPVMSVAAPIIALHDLEAGDRVGYGDVRLNKAERIAVLRIGYGDGYRRLKNGSVRYVMVNGLPCKLVGQVCMDMCTVIVSNVPNVAVGDRAFILGGGIDCRTIADEWGTIVYEVLTSFNERVERVYVKNETTAERYDGIQACSR